MDAHTRTVWYYNLLVLLQIIQSIPIIGSSVSGSCKSDLESGKDHNRLPNKYAPARASSLVVLATSAASSATSPTSGTHSELDLRLQSQFPVSSCLIPESGSFTSAWPVNPPLRERSQNTSALRTTRFHTDESSKVHSEPQSHMC